MDPYEELEQTGNTFVYDQERGKVVLRFSKEHYMGLSEDDKRQIKRKCLFSRKESGWIMRRSGPAYDYDIAFFQSIGLQNGGTCGERLTYAERIENKKERAAERAEYQEEKAERAKIEAGRAFNSASEIASYIPLGQPILVGHHSERRHRRDLERIDSRMQKGLELERKAQYHAQRAAAASGTAEDNRAQDTGFCQRRIEEAKKAIAAGWRGPEHQEKLEYWTKQLEEIGGVQYGKHNMKVGGFAKIRGHWVRIDRLNPKTISYTIMHGPCAGWNWLKNPYAEIRDYSETDPEATS